MHPSRQYGQEGVHVFMRLYPSISILSPDFSSTVKWSSYGWLTDAVLVAVICVFTPIAPLRAVLGGFFQIIMFNGSALLHIGVCLLLSAAFSLAGLAVLKRKTL